MSRASSIIFYRCRAEFRIIFNFLKNYSPNLESVSLFIIILRRGIIEFKGVLNSCATDEKNVALIFFSDDSYTFNLEISVQITINYLSLFIF